MLIAICGEFPADLLLRLPGSISYYEALVFRLKKQKLLHSYYRDKLRGLRLSTRSKTYLLEEYPERFSFYLTGNADTNVLKSEVTRRLRLHRIAEIYLMMRNAGVAVFRDEKPLVFAHTPSFTDLTSDFTAGFSAFYSSREVKELGIEAVKIRGSRMAGVLLAPSGVFLVYNGGPGKAKWDYRAEQRAQALLQFIVCRQRLFALYGGQRISGLLIGNGMEPFCELLASADSNTRCFFLLDGGFKHFYYLTNDRCGDVLLQLLRDPVRTADLDRTLMQGLHPREPDSLIEQDAIDGEGNPVLFGYFLDIPRINRFLTGLQLRERKGILICFDFQEEALRSCCSGDITIQTICFEKFERRFCH